MTAFQHILLVDDDNAFTTVLERALTRRGIAVTTANSSGAIYQQTSGEFAFRQANLSY